MGNVAQLVLECLVLCKIKDSDSAFDVIGAAGYLVCGLVVLVAGYVVFLVYLAFAMAAYLAIGEDCSDSDVFEDAEWLLSVR